MDSPLLKTLINSTQHPNPNVQYLAYNALSLIATQGESKMSIILESFHNSTYRVRLLSLAPIQEAIVSEIDLRQLVRDQALKAERGEEFNELDKVKQKLISKLVQKGTNPSTLS